MTIYMTMFQNSNAIVLGTSFITTNASVYTRYAIGAMIAQAGTVDSVELSFVIGNGSSSTLSLSTYVILDDVHLGTGSASGIHEQSGASSISVFPNPSASFVNFEVKEKSAVEVYAVDGSLLLSQIVEAGNVQLNLADLPEGMLMLVVRNENYSGRQQIVHVR